jgi:uncharacterized protein
MVTKLQIEDFYKQGSIAIAGVSRKKNKFGRVVYDELKKKGINVLPINPQTDDIEGDICYRDIASLPGGVNAVAIITRKTQTLDVVKQAVAKGVKNIWIQQGSDTNETHEFLEQHNVNLIYGKCIMMFSEPVGGMHKFHRSVMRFFGKLPK